jgi:hypothetical protein
MTTYTVSVYGVYKADNKTFDIDAESLNHAARFVKDNGLNKGAMTTTVKVKGSKRSYRVEQLDGWHDYTWAQMQRNKSFGIPQK